MNCTLPVHAGFVNSAGSKRKEIFLPFPLHFKQKKSDLRKIKVDSHRQKRYFSKKKLEEYGEFANRGTISGVTGRLLDESDLDFQTARRAAIPAARRFQSDFKEIFSVEKCSQKSNNASLIG